MLQSGGLNWKWPTNGWIGYINPCRLGGVPNASQRGTKSEAAHKWANWLRNRHGIRNQCKRYMRPMYQSHLPFLRTGAHGIRTQCKRFMHSMYQSHLPFLPTRAHGIGNECKRLMQPCAVWRVPNASQRGTESEVAHRWADWQHHWCSVAGLQRFSIAHKMRSGPQVGRWLHHPYHLGGPKCFKAVDKIRRGQQMGALATSSSPMPSWAGIK